MLVNEQQEEISDIWLSMLAAVLHTVGGRITLTRKTYENMGNNWMLIKTLKGDNIELHLEYTVKED